MERGDRPWGTSPVAPWLHGDALHEIPPAKRGHHGYLLRREDHGVLPKKCADLPALQRAVGRTTDSAPLFAWLPSHRHSRTIYELDELADAVAARARTESEQALRRARPRAVLAVALIAAAVVFWPADQGTRVMILLGTFLLLGPLWGHGVEAWLGARRTLHRIASAPDRWRQLQSERLRYEAWSEGGSSYTGTGLAVASAAVYALMVVRGTKPSIAALALVKERVIDGEVWRLFTCTLMHGGVFHIYMNVLIGLALAATARRLVSESRVLLTFLVAALAGSVASTWLTPATSVGASGGILGWGGMLAGLALVHPDVRRTGVLSGMLRWAVMLALLGLAGAGFIDNAAHAGGFAAGMILGVLFARFSPRALPLGGNKLSPAFWLLAAPAAAGAVAMLVVLLRL